ncbi:hypothetical protein [Legionella spiritensis]|uniref:hypothetical protein n=1 Tax=Legionella spiritensis TaxID=452 RepID=UPI000F6BF9EC|nr:hypothetical protein [Legionella spiritensis]VEG91097.1 Uncharacterised protein [Legionella spiritensis]
MNMKSVILGSTLALSLATAPFLHAQPTATISQPAKSHFHHHKCFKKLLDSEQQQELRTIMQGMRQQMIPLIKERQALKLQLKGKIATSGTQWADIAPLVTSLNENNAKVTMLKTKTELAVFQKLGIMLPPPPHGKPPFAGHHKRPF